jgi:hypothetical protein
VALKRNSSLTRDEIDAYWRAKKKAEEEHFTAAISEISDGVQVWILAPVRFIKIDK